MEREQSANRETGQQFIGKVPLRMEESLPALNRKEVASPEPSLLELMRYFLASISLFHNFAKETKHTFLAHLTMSMVLHSFGLQLVVNQFLKDLMLTLISRLLSAITSQSIKKNMLSQRLQPCNQVDACGSTLLPLKIFQLHWSSLVRMRRELMPQVLTTSQLSHAILKSGSRIMNTNNSSLRKVPDLSKTENTAGNFAVR